MVTNWPGTRVSSSPSSTPVRCSFPCQTRKVCSSLGWECISSFFFQAEDGIRDLTVTGVQTCALPIYLGFDFLIAVLLDRREDGAESAIGIVGNFLPGFLNIFLKLIELRHFPFQRLLDSVDRKSVV